MELLDLSTIVEKVTVRIRSKRHPAGKLYDLVSLDDLGVYEHQKVIQLHGQSVELLQSTKPLTEPQARTLSKGLGELVKMLLPGIEPAVIAELTNAKRSQIITAWALRNQGETPSEEGKARPKRTTAASSRRSKGSTAATRKRGSTSRPG